MEQLGTYRHQLLEKVGMQWVDAGIVGLQQRGESLLGLVLYFAGAIVAHLRARDPAMQGAAAFLALAVATTAVLLLDF